MNHSRLNSAGDFYPNFSRRHPSGPGRMYSGGSAGAGRLNGRRGSALRALFRGGPGVWAFSASMVPLRRGRLGFLWPATAGQIPSSRDV